MNYASLFIDYTTSVKGEETTIRIFEKPTKVFIYIYQTTKEVRRYDDKIESVLKKSRVRNKYQFIIFANLIFDDMVLEVGDVIINILKKKMMK